MKQVYLEAFMDMVERFAQTSNATRLKVGSCLIKNGNPLCFGVNGSVEGHPSNICEDTEGNTLSHIRHSEIACLNKLRTINETSIGCTMLITHAPCINCSYEIVASGIKQVYFRHDYRCRKGIEYLRSNGVGVVQLKPVEQLPSENK